MHPRPLLPIVVFGIALAGCEEPPAQGSSADAGTEADAGCGVVLVHQPLAEAQIGAPAPISARIAGAGGATLHYRGTGETGWSQRELGGPGEVAAEVPGDSVGTGGFDYYLEVRAPGCVVFSPPRGGEAPHHVRAYGAARLTEESDGYDFLPAVSGSRVVWASESTGGSAGIFLRDLDTGEQRKLAGSARSQGPAVIDGDNVVWVDGRHRADAYDENVELYLHDLTTGQEHRLTEADKGQYAPEISGRLVVWRDDRGRGSTTWGDIYGYDLGPDRRYGTPDDPGEVAIAVAYGDQTAPDVHADSPTGRVRVVWQDMRDDADGKCDSACDSNVYLLDFGPDGRFGTSDDVGPTRVTSEPHEQTAPVIWGRRIAWLDARGGNWMKPEIYVYDLGDDGLFGTSDDGGEAKLEASTAEPDHLDLDGDRLVYDDFRDGSFEVFLWDFAAGAETALTREKLAQTSPRVSGRAVVWQDARENSGEDFVDDVYVHLLR